jgi:hypothetical protein
MKKLRQKFLLVRYEQDCSVVYAKIVWEPRFSDFTDADVVLDLDYKWLRKNRYGWLTKEEYNKYYNDFKEIIKNSCTSNRLIIETEDKSWE